MKWRLSAWLLLVLLVPGRAQSILPDFLENHNSAWVDSVFRSLTLDEKIGQLLMPRGNYSGRDHDTATLKKWVRDYKVGGIVFFASSPTKQAAITNELQKLTKTPLIIGQDFEWGVGMRLDSTDRFPYAVAIGAVDGHDDVVESMGREVARQCRRIGVHINYAPVVDVNNNPANPVINFRSYGSDKEIVAARGLAYMKGMQQERIFCTAKHFPGHGDTSVDSHHDLPIISHDRDRLNEVELYPFKKLINNGLSGIMTAHLNIPAIEPTEGMASTFSPNIIDGMLKKELGFQGLIFTDAMEMQGAIKNYAKGEAMVRALLAGNDVLETFMDVPGTVEAIKTAIAKKVLPMTLIDAKVKKILKAKAWVGLDKYAPIDMDNLTEDLNTIEGDVINHTLTEKSVTCLKNDDQLLPIRDLNKKFAVLSVESAGVSDFYHMASNYVHADFYHIQKNAPDSAVLEVLKKVDAYDHILAAFHLPDIRASKQYGLNDQNSMLFRHFSRHPRAIITLLGNPFILGKIPELAACRSLLLGYQQSRYTEQAAAQIIFGALPASGTLPILVNDTFQTGMGIKWQKLDRLCYGVPEQAGIDRVPFIKGIDSLVAIGLKEKAFPGGVVQVARNGRVIFSRAYGYHTYEEAAQARMNAGNPAGSAYSFIDDAMDNPEDLKTTLRAPAIADIPVGRMQTTDIFDLASVTKISTATMAAMQLISAGTFSLDEKLATYHPAFKSSNKGQMKMKDLLTHRAGLTAWIPFWKYAVDTAATMAGALNAYPELEKECIIEIKKPGFIRRIFGAKPRRTVNCKETFSKNPPLFEKIISTTPVVWKNNLFYTVKTEKFPVAVCEGVYLKKDYANHIMQQIADSPVNPEQGYVYSDLHFYLYPAIVKRLTGLSFESYLDKTYTTLGARTLTFNPLKKFPESGIVPTEYDSLFRRQLIHGFVHDEGAALLGGVSGHAGLFGNANDLMKLMQMYLQKGSYGGVQYIRPDIVDQCTSYQFPQEKNRRGIGFDKKDFNPEIKNAPARASAESYGHSGFTGTYTWIDPKYQLVYVFLSNRVYPTRNNPKLSNLNIRPAIGDHIISCIQE